MPPGASRHETAPGATTAAEELGSLDTAASALIAQSDTLFIASAPKLAAFAVVIRVLVSGLIVASRDWQMMLIILSVLSMAVGNFAGDGTTPMAPHLPTAPQNMTNALFVDPAFWADHETELRARFTAWLGGE